MPSAQQLLIRVLPWFFLVTCLATVLLQESLANPALQVSIRTRGKHGAPEQDLENILGLVSAFFVGLAVTTCPYLHVDLTQLVGRAWGIRAVEPLEKDDQLVGLPPVMELKLAGPKEKHPGTKVWVETEDILARFRSPQRDPEPDLDSLYHPPMEEVQVEEKPWSPVLLPRQVLRGPEEDLDHIHHPVEDSREP